MTWPCASGPHRKARPLMWGGAKWKDDVSGTFAQVGLPSDGTSTCSDSVRETIKQKRNRFLQEMETHWSYSFLDGSIVGIEIVGATQHDLMNFNTADPTY